MGHYRENDSNKKTNALDSKSGWMGKERLTDQYIVGVFIGTVDNLSAHQSWDGVRDGYVDMG